MEEWGNGGGMEEWWGNPPGATVHLQDNESVLGGGGGGAQVPLSHCLPFLGRRPKKYQTYRREKTRTETSPPLSACNFCDEGKPRLRAAAVQR
jgi:hypothetical protein